MDCRWLLVVGCWSVGRWLLVGGRWLLVVGRSSMVMVTVRIVWSHSLSTLCVKILKWRSVTDSLTKVRYRAARAAKKEIQIEVVLLNLIQSGPSEHKIWDIVQPSCHRLNSPASDSSCG